MLYGGKYNENIMQMINIITEMASFVFSKGKATAGSVKRCSQTKHSGLLMGKM